MKNRAELIQHCQYPLLPEHCVNTATPTTGTNISLVGGRLASPASQEGFVLSSQFHKLKCFVTKNCCLFFDFDEHAKKVNYKDVFPLLREGDHLLLYVNGTIKRKEGKREEIPAYAGPEDAQASSGSVADMTAPAGMTVQEGREDAQASSGSVADMTAISKMVLVSVNTKDRALYAPRLTAWTGKKWFDFLNCAHAGMALCGLHKISSPTLVECPGTEPDLHFFETRLYPPKRNTEQTQMFLSASPEIFMKRLLCRGWTDIYEIKKCFRNKETGPLNHIEFYLLEWYRAYSGLATLIKDLQTFLNFMSKKTVYRPFPPLQKVSMKELFKKYLNMELKPYSSARDFIPVLKRNNIPFNDTDSVDDLFYLLFLNKIEPCMNKDIPLVIYDYPPFQKAYARLGPEGWALRFELFWKGMELANAFNEVINSDEQAERFKEDNLKRAQRGKPTVPPSHALLKDMRAGMPPSSGIALGLDRLFLALTGSKDINALKPEF